MSVFLVIAARFFFPNPPGLLWNPILASVLQGKFGNEFLVFKSLSPLREIPKNFFPRV